MSNSSPTPSSQSSPSTADSGKSAASDSGNSATPSGAGAPLTADSEKSAAPSLSATPGFIGIVGQRIDPSVLSSFFQRNKPDLPEQVSHQLSRIFEDIVNGKFGIEHLDWEIHLLELIQDYPIVIQRYLNLFGRESGLEKVRAHLISNNNLPDFLRFMKCLRDTIRQGYLFHEFNTLERLVLHKHPDLWKEFENFPFERTNDSTGDNKSTESSEDVPSSTKSASDKQNEGDASPDDPVPASINQVAADVSSSNSASKKQKTADASSSDSASKKQKAADASSSDSPSKKQKTEDK